MTKRLFVGIFVLASAVSAFGQSKPPIPDAHLGTWKLNLAKSKITPAPTGPQAQSITRTYEEFGDGLKATLETVSADGKRTTATYSAHFDGKDYPYTGSATIDAIALKRIDSHSFEATNKKAGKAVITGTNVVSNDGKTLTWTYKGTNAQGQPTSGVQVFEKQ